MGAVGRQEHEFGADTLDGIANSGCLVRRQVVYHEDVTRLTGRDQNLLDVR
ncbi:hypothetical protein PPNSA23_41580 [Phyllobacterium phragmitis]|uniref:Uncharacterized protein n=1 Tax=Phyllobacterium phragmitis TaxID=2670329 RepID=A0ABQ0H5N5_9HYPH